MLTSSIQQSLFTNISYQPKYFQQQRPQQFNQPQFQAFPQFQPQQFQTQPSHQFQKQPSQVPLSQSPPINLVNDDDNQVEETQPSRRRQPIGKATKRRNVLERR